MKIKNNGESWSPLQKAGRDASLSALKEKRCDSRFSPMIGGDSRANHPAKLGSTPSLPITNSFLETPRTHPCSRCSKPTKILVGNLFVCLSCMTKQERQAYIKYSSEGYKDRLLWREWREYDR